MAVSMGKKATRAIGAATLFAVAGLLAMPNLAKAQDETFSQTGTIPVPGMTSFDISYVSPNWNGAGKGQYFLADRSNKAIDTYNISSGVIGSFKAGNFVGAVGTPVNNNLSGPNGVAVVNTAGFEVWAGDGPQPNAGCPQSFPLNGSCSAVKVMSQANNGALTHVIPTNGLARADELCFDPVDNIVLMANDAESAQNPKLGTPFISFISTKTYQVVAQMSFGTGAGQINATNGIEQCQYDRTTGLFFLNLPEVNGPGDDTADGQVVVIQGPTAAAPTSASIVAEYIIPTVDCAGPQGMAVGPEPQLLLACNAKGPNGVQNSLVIDKHTGSVMAIGWGIGGADQGWFNPGDSHYFVTGSSLPSPSLAVVDGTGPGAVDQIIATPKQAGASPHSVAADSNTLLLFIPNGGGVGIFTPSPMDSDDANIVSTWPGVNP